MSPRDVAEVRRRGLFVFLAIAVIATSIVWAVQCSGDPDLPRVESREADRREPIAESSEPASLMRVSSPTTSAAEGSSELSVMVLERSGQPVGGAYVFALEDQQTRFVSGDGESILARTDESGMARIRFESHLTRGIFVASTGFVSSSVLHPAGPATVTVHLDRGLDQEFRVRDHEGQPLAGARIVVTGYKLISPDLVPSGILLSGPFSRDAVHLVVSDPRGEAKISGLLMQPHSIGVVHPTHGWSMPVFEAHKISRMIPGPTFEIVMRELQVAIAEFKGDVIDVCNMGYETDAIRPFDGGIGHEFSISGLYRHLRQKHPNALCSVKLPREPGTAIIARWDVFARHSGWHVFRQPMQGASAVEPVVFELPPPAGPSPQAASGIVRLKVLPQDTGATLPMRQLSLVRSDDHHDIRVFANVNLDGSPSHIPPGTYKLSTHPNPFISAAFRGLGTIEVTAGAETNLDYAIPFDLCSCRVRFGSTIGSPGTAKFEVTHPGVSATFDVSDGDEITLPRGSIRYSMHFPLSGEFDLLPLNGEATLGPEVQVLDLGITRVRGEDRR
ncbi:MAG: hypothetical protein AB7I19_14245 [Planctomycetota bacterium]